MQIIDTIRKELKDKGIPVLKLSKDTGISAYKIYKWLDKKGSPKHEDVLLLDKWLRNSLENVPTGNGSTNPIPVVTDTPTPYAQKNPGEPGQASESVLLREIISLKDQIIAMQSKENHSLQKDIVALTEKVEGINGTVSACSRLIQESNQLSREANQLTAQGNSFLKQLEGLAELAKVAREQDPSERKEFPAYQKTGKGKSSRASGK